MLFLYFLAGSIIGFIAGYTFTDRRQLQSINKKLFMAQETLNELKTIISGQSTTLDNIAADIQRIKDGLPTTGGLTKAEVDELRIELTAVGTKASNLDLENEPPTEPPVEG